MQPETGESGGAPLAPDMAARLFAALGDPTRLALMRAMADGGAKSIRELSAPLPISRQGVTKHLRVLEQAGVLVAEPAGRECRWRGNPEALGAARAYLDEVAQAWDGALSRLKQLVELSPDPVSRR